MIRRRYQRKSSNPVPSIEWRQRVAIIYDLCMPLLHSRFRTWSTDDCMDAFHSAIVRCLDAEESLAPLPDDQLCKKILSWTGGELSNIHRRRKQQRTSASQLADRAPPNNEQTESPTMTASDSDRRDPCEDVFSRAAIHVDLVGALGTLKVDDVVILLLSAIGFDIADIASILHCNETTTWQRLHRARIHLAILLGPEYLVRVRQTASHGAQSRGATRRRSRKTNP